MATRRPHTSIIARVLASIVAFNLALVATLATPAPVQAVTFQDINRMVAFIDDLSAGAGNLATGHPLTAAEGAALRTAATQLGTYAAGIQSAQLGDAFQKFQQAREALNAIGSVQSINELIGRVDELAQIQEALPAIEIIQQLQRGQNISPAQIQQVLAPIIAKLPPAQAAVVQKLSDSAKELGAAISIVQAVKTGDISQALGTVVQAINIPPELRTLVSGAAGAFIGGQPQLFFGALAQTVINRAKSALVQTAVEAAAPLLGEGAQKIGQALEKILSGDTELGKATAQIAGLGGGAGNLGNLPQEASCFGGGGGGGGGGVFGSILGGIQNAVKGAITTAASALGGKLSSVLSSAAGAVGLGNIASIFTGASSIATSVTGAAGGRGVPVIEQQGELLETTKNILKTALENTKVNTQSCTILANMLQNQTVVRQIQRAAIINSTLAAVRGVADQSNANLVQNLKKYQRERIQVTTRHQLKDIKDNKKASGATKQAAGQYIAYILQNNENTLFNRALDNGASTGNESFLDLVDPRISALATVVNVNNQIARQVESEAQYAYDDIRANGGYKDTRLCVPGATNERGKCIEEYIAQSGATIMRLLAQALLVPLQQFAFSTEEYTSNEQSQAAAVSTASYVRDPRVPTPQQFQTGPTTPPSIPNESALNTSSLLDLYRSLCALGISLPFCNTGDTGQPPQPPPPPPVLQIPPPALTIATTTRHLAGTTLTELTWRATSITSCKVNSDWISYGTTSAPTLTPVLFLAKDTVLPATSTVATGTVVIFHPAIFHASASAEELPPDTNNAPPASQSEAITNKIAAVSTNFPSVRTTITQRAEYTASTTNSEPEDVYIFGLNSLLVLTTAASSIPEDIANRLRAAMISAATVNQERALEYAKYQITGTSSVIALRAQEVEGLIPTFADYQISCVGRNGETARGGTLIKFTD